MWFVIASAIGVAVGFWVTYVVLSRRWFQQPGFHRPDDGEAWRPTAVDIVRAFDWPRYPPAVPSQDAQ